MPITPRPRENQNPTTAVDVDALIARGGSVASEPPPAPPAAPDAAKGGGSPTPVVLRIPPAQLARIEAALGARSVRIPRHTWLLEAVAEKLERDGV